MALSVPKTSFQHMLKDGAKHLKGLDEAVFRNIDACKQLTKITKSSYGPNGLNKMVINQLEKLFVTSDAATVIKELEVQHPAAKMLILASQMQEQEVGDGTNFVMVFGGELLSKAEELLRMGLSPPEIIEGYDKACDKALEILPNLSCYTIKNIRDHDEVTKTLKSSVASKQFGNEDLLSELITKACVRILPESGLFNVDNVRVVKILGSGVSSSHVVQGMVFKREVEGNIGKVENAKIAVFSCPLDSMGTETKGTVLIKSAEELKAFSPGAENLLESQIKSIVDAGCNVVVTGGKVGDMALHFCNKYNLMVVRLTSKWELRRVCKAVGAVALPKMTRPTVEEIGRCKIVQVDEIGDTSVIVFKQESADGAISTIVIRGSTDSIMDDVERAIDDGVNTFKQLTRDGRCLPGAGATEIELALQLATYAETFSGLEQYAIKKFAEALEVFPKVLAETSGVSGNEVISKMYASHNDGCKNSGFDVEAGTASLIDVSEASIFDTLAVKHNAIKMSSNAAVTILRVDQIIMAKPAGGPKPRAGGNRDED
ncbi:T-complex protein 1 subunit theta-like [Xenia sp. Carnegie-2017]|uniref:T-complex protein 1 subunit theta-like n=1 Tax=Xenia sp. Carnegie-2017 TaxID=2897299 RepID=UPI001F0440FB|nr:T-complex protein 1 subunit theta-like [Xenia sp. Carnegie-2017]